MLLGDGLDLGVALGMRLTLEARYARRDLRAGGRRSSREESKLRGGFPSSWTTAKALVAAKEVEGRHARRGARAARSGG